MLIPAGSVEYVHVDVTVTRENAPTQPVDATARMAFVPSRTTPAEDDWDTADYTAGVVRRRYDGNLPPGAYDVWVEITAGDEIPLVNAGRLDLA